MEGQTYKLEKPFLVLATQNPIEYEGTYPLPEAQIDRFLLKLSVGYPSPQEEKEILTRMKKVDLHDAKVDKMVYPNDILKMQEVVKSVFIDEKIEEYIVNIVHSTRNDPRVEVGVSPRGSIALFKLSKAHAAFYGRDYVIPDDVKQVVIPAIAHRLVLKTEMRFKGIRPEQVVEEIINSIPVPTAR